MDANKPDTVVTSAKLRYQQHKANAKQRGIEFDLTFEEWQQIWGEHLAARGRGAGQMQMCRARDEGGYRPGNVRIDTVEGNRAEARMTLSTRAIQKAWDYGTHNNAESRFAMFERNRVFRTPYHALRAKEEENDELDE
jgi:hypothetical protein